MGTLKKTLAKMQFDKRVVQFNIQNGDVTQDNYKQHRDQLQDMAANAMKIDLEEETSSEPAAEEPTPSSDTPIF